MKTRRADVLALLMMPPPVHGASAINQKMVQHLEACGVPVTVLNTVSSHHARWFDGSAWKFLRALQILRVFGQVLLRRSSPPASVYIGISGGAGLLFDCVLALAIRLLDVSVVVHHHSFSYVTANSGMFRRFCTLLNTVPVTHVVLCSEMGEQLCARYPALISQKQLHVLSNAAFFEDCSEKSRTTKASEKLCVGYISNITPEKGIHDVLELFERCRASDMPIQMVVAGPCANATIRAELEALSAGSEPFTYLGAVYGERKHEFFQALDVLVFPTRYENEAEPLVIYEAAEQAVPAIAYARGCIASMVQNCGGWSVKPEGNFLDEALAIIKAIAVNRILEERKKQALSGSEYLRGSSQGALQELLAKMRKAHDTAS